MHSKAIQDNDPIADSLKPTTFYWSPLYVSLVIILGIGIALRAIQEIPRDIIGLLAFIVIATIAELGSVEIRVTRRRNNVPVSSILAVASILTLGPLSGALTLAACGTSSIVVAILFNKGPAAKRGAWLQGRMFNHAKRVISAGIAGWVFTAAGGVSGAIIRLDNLLPLLAAATADSASNLSLHLTEQILRTGRPVMETWNQDIQGSAPFAITGVALGGGGLAVAHEWLGLLGVAVFFLPVLISGYTLRSARNAALEEQLEPYLQPDSQDEASLRMLMTLSFVIDAYNLYTYGHSTQVSVYARAIAEQLSLPEQEINILVKASLVHDIGKVGITDSIIGKQGPLTDEEYNIVKRHPAIGATIVGQLRSMERIAELVRHHHERWDGKGYPDGISGHAIPLGARILALADAVDTLCSDRPYRPTRNFYGVLEEIQRCSGTQFDPQVVRAFLAVVEERGSRFF